MSDLRIYVNDILDKEKKSEEERNQSKKKQSVKNMNA
jgi:hypothetical protein